jgi:hypothetical protein
MIPSPQPPAPTPQPRWPKAARESGYAMLLVFLMAAMIAIALYNELPRVAFEAQRAKEQLLIERGEQYKRAIQLFVRKMNRYPGSIEELESANNFRFLRKRYVDPMTGKDKWRLIHINGGVLTDSIIQKNKPGQDQQQPANTNTFIGEGPALGANNDPNQQQINPALRRRASDDRPVATPDAPATPPPDAGDDSSASDSDNNDNNTGTPAPGTQGATAAVPGMPNQQTPGMPPGRFPQPGMYPGQPGYNPATANQPYGMMPGTQPNQMSGAGGTGGFPNNIGQNPSQDSSGSVYVAPSLGQTSNVNAGSPTGFPGQQPGFPGQQAGYPGQQAGFPGQQAGFPGQQAGYPGQQAGFPGSSGAFPGRPGALPNAFGQPAQMSGFGGGNDPASQNTNSGAGMSNFGLTSPSQIQPQGGALPGMGGTQVGGGIAGVASESTGPAIKVYNERKKYNEWEFVYDQTKDRGLAGVQGNGGAPGTPAGQMGSMPPGMNPQQPGGAGAPFGMNSQSQGGQAGQGGAGSIFTPSTGFGSPGQQQPQPQQPPN